MHVTQELLALARELEGRLVLKDTGGQTQQAGQAVVLDGPVLLVQDLAAVCGQTRAEVAKVTVGWRNVLSIRIANIY